MIIIFSKSDAHGTDGCVECRLLHSGCLQLLGRLRSFRVNSLRGSMGKEGECRSSNSKGIRTQTGLNIVKTLPYPYDFFSWLSSVVSIYTPIASNVTSNAPYKYK
jgi:hypothetical protein